MRYDIHHPHQTNTKQKGFCGGREGDGIAVTTPWSFLSLSRETVFLHLTIVIHDLTDNGVYSFSMTLLNRVCHNSPSYLQVLKIPRHDIESIESYESPERSMMGDRPISNCITAISNCSL